MEPCWCSLTLSDSLQRINRKLNSFPSLQFPRRLHFLLNTFINFWIKHGVNSFAYFELNRCLLIRTTFTTAINWNLTFTWLTDIGTLRLTLIIWKWHLIWAVAWRCLAALFILFILQDWSSKWPETTCMQNFTLFGIQLGLFCISKKIRN